MDFQEGLYCEIFVNASLEEIGLTRTIAEILGGEIDKSFKTPHIVNAGLTILDVRKNGYFDESRVNLPKGFVCFPYLIEVDALQEQTRQAHIAVVSELLTGLWKNGMQAVAACEFEDELPPNPNRQRQ